MDKLIYLKIHNFLQKNNRLIKPVKLISFISPYIMMIIFYGLIPFLLFNKSEKFFIYIFMPALMYLIITPVRKKINRTRPFDELNLTPIEPHKSGNSFPSMHCASAVVITMAVYSISYPLFLICLITSTAVIITRLLVGVHYPSDVFGGVIIGFLFGLVYII